MKIDLFPWIFVFLLYAFYTRKQISANYKATLAKIFVKHDHEPTKHEVLGIKSGGIMCSAFFTRFTSN
jgi:hypothetical protein